jgi:hypothetical protein
MSEHLADELPGLLTGEASRATVAAAAEHLRTCPDCQHDLVDAVVAHAALTSARRFAPEVAQRPAGTAPAEHPLPDLAAVFAQLDAEEAQAGDAEAPLVLAGRGRRRRIPTRFAVAAAAAVIVGGLGAGIGLVGTSSGTAGDHIALTAYGVGVTDGSATLRGDRLSISATSLPSLDARHRYEVWLTDAARTSMQPVGWIDTGGRADLTVPSALVQRYADIEVSVQQLDAPDYTYSGTSVLRGSYA